MGSSATEDVYGEKDVTSLFAEFQVPITDKINAQLAIRHEDYDSKSATVGKLALGYEVNTSFHKSLNFNTFRAPNLVQVNQLRVARTGTRIDSVMRYVASVNNLPKSGTIGDYDYRPSLFEGARALEPEESDNTFGLVITPESIEGLTITFDAWEIEKEIPLGYLEEITMV